MKARHNSDSNQEKMEISLRPASGDVRVVICQKTTCLQITRVGVERK